MAITIQSDVAFMYRPIVALPALGRGDRTSQTLGPGEIIEVTAPANVGGITGQVKVITSAGPGAAETVTTLNNGAAQSFGPTNEQMAVTVINQPFSPGSASLSIARRN